MISEIVLSAVVACPSCISSVGGTGESYMWATVLMIAVPGAVGGFMVYMFRSAAAQAG